MPFAPITGKLRKRFWLDMSCALGLGISGAYAYWSVFFKSLQRQEEFYLKLERQKQEA
ncbi:COX7A, subunit VIIa of cytochrome c oxidase [Russula dissimulans]|nr:COX7A, subunit VIIa of cytochrome c oxidase [Russula dissimulans]